MSQPRRLTDRQAAILAAVERLGDPTIPDLHLQFPDLFPSAIAKVLDALEARALVARAGEPDQIYLGGVRFWSTALSPTQIDERLRAARRVIAAEATVVDSWLDPDRRTLTLLVPLAAFQADLAGDSDALEGLRACLRSARSQDPSLKAELGSEIATPRGQSCLMVVLRADD